MKRIVRSEIRIKVGESGVNETGQANDRRKKSSTESERYLGKWQWKMLQQDPERRVYIVSLRASGTAKRTQPAIAEHQQ